MSPAALAVAGIAAYALALIATLPARFGPRLLEWVDPPTAAGSPGKVANAETVMIPDGDRLILELPGGAGMGDPATRDPLLVARDVRDGLVSTANARAQYRVALAADGSVDEKATRDLRS